MTVSGPLGGFPEARAHLLATATPGADAARALSDLTDGIIVRLASQAPADAAYAIFALGGYGARRLLPGSDIDLLIVPEGSGSELQPLVRAVIYPLWDTGFTVGHQVRSIKTHVTALGQDVANATAFLTARFLAGDAVLADRAVARSFRRLARDARPLRQAILARKRPGSPYLLEPDLKEGCGGQRDLDEIAWHAALAAGMPNADPSALVASGPLTAEEAGILGSAASVLTAARWSLHLAHGRADNTLTLDAADDAQVDADAVQRALADVDDVLLRVRERLGAPVATVPGRFGLPELRALAAGDDASLASAERAAREGLLDGAVPGFRELMTLRRPALSHRYTVGEHSLRAVNALGTDSDLPDGLRDALLVVALAHDAGKAAPQPGHAARGAAIAEAAARSLGLPPGGQRAAATLVAEHLSLADLAVRADPSDEDAVLELAARLGDGALVAPLFALTAADMRATGTDVWTAWRAAVVSDAASRLERALSDEVDGAGIVQAAEATRRDALREAASVGASAAVLRFLESAPLRYLARRLAHDALRDARLVQSIAGPGAPGRFAFSVGAGPAEGTWLVSVVTRDRPGLFATLSGALALAGLSALTAEAHTTRHGIAVDVFVVTSATLAPVEMATWNRFERLFGAALNGGLDLDLRLAERRRHYPPRNPRRVRPSVEIGEAGAFSTPVRVRAADRVGLLHDLARAFAKAGLDIQRATIATTSGVADDAFEVTQTDGEPPDAATLRIVLVPLLNAAIAAG